MKLFILFSLVAAATADASSGGERFLQDAVFVTLPVCQITKCAEGFYCTEPVPDFAVCRALVCQNVVCPGTQVCVGKDLSSATPTTKCIDDPCKTPFALEVCPSLCRVNDLEEAAYCEGVGKIEEPAAGGIDSWFDIAKENYTGDLGVKRCGKVQAGIKPVPTDGISCSKNPKACFFGNQLCGAAGLPYPDTLCECINRKWACDEALACPAE